MRSGEQHKVYIYSIKWLRSGECISSKQKKMQFCNICCSAIPVTSMEWRRYHVQLCNVALFCSPFPIKFKIIFSSLVRLQFTPVCSRYVFLLPMEETMTQVVRFKNSIRTLYLRSLLPQPVIFQLYKYCYYNSRCFYWIYTCT